MISREVYGILTCGRENRKHSRQRTATTDNYLCGIPDRFGQCAHGGVGVCPNVLPRSLLGS